MVEEISLKAEKFERKCIVYVFFLSILVLFKQDADYAEWLLWIWGKCYKAISADYFHEIILMEFGMEVVDNL